MFSEEILEFNHIRNSLEEHCPSSIAKEMARSLEIMTDEKVLEEMLQETMEATISLQTEVEQPIGGTRDIRIGLSKSKKDIILTREELWDIYVTLLAYKRTKHFFDERYLHYPLLSLWTQDMENHEGLERKYMSIFDKKGNLMDQATPKLSQLRKTIHHTKERLKRELQAILNSKENQKYFQESIVTQRNDRYVIPVKQEYRYNFDGIVHDKSATGATLYIEPMVMVKLNNDLQEAILEEEREVIRIYKELSQYIKSCATQVEDSCRRISHIEFVYGKALYGLTYKGVCAKINRKGQVKLLKGRHPLLKASTVVPSTILLGDEYKILLITGSNTGGKTVTLKTLGLLSMMHQAGLPIPAEDGSELPVFKGIYADIGDEQSIEESLSTFSGHMVQLRHIMDHVGPQDLVLIDELGSGTDPEEGSALAVAIMDYFRGLGPLMMVTTHYNDLKNYAYHTDGIENGHVEFDEETLQPTYKLRIGVAGSSHALSIASRLGLPEKVITMAKEHKSGSRHHDMEDVLAQLNEQLRLSEDKEERLQKELAEAKEMRNKAQRELNRVEEKKKAILDKAKVEAYNLKRSLKVETEQIIKELKAQFNEKDQVKRANAIQDARKALDEIELPKISIDKRKKVKADALEVGKVVFVNTLESLGTIKAIEGKRIQLEVNGLTVSVKIGDISQSTRDEATQVVRKEKRSYEQQLPRKVKASAVARQAAVRTELNILGQTVDEALISVGQFIDQALLGGINSVKIIHGKGTGALRAGIHDYLRTLPVVKKYEQAGFDDGGAGATIVYLK